MNYRNSFSVLIVFIMLIAAGCHQKEATPVDAREKETDQKVLEKYGKSFVELFLITA